MPAPGNQANTRQAPRRGFRAPASARASRGPGNQANTIAGGPTDEQIQMMIQSMVRMLGPERRGDGGNIMIPDQQPGYRHAPRQSASPEGRGQGKRPQRSPSPAGRQGKEPQRGPDWMQWTAPSWMRNQPWDNWFYG